MERGMVIWRVTPDYIGNNWSERFFWEMVRKAVERNQMEQAAYQTPYTLQRTKPAFSSGSQPPVSPPKNKLPLAEFAKATPGLRVAGV